MCISAQGVSSLFNPLVLIEVAGIKILNGSDRSEAIVIGARVVFVVDDYADRGNFSPRMGLIE